jgi:hypothetical protein
MHDATLSLRQELGQGFEPVLFEVGHALLKLIKIGRDVGVVFGDTMQGRSQEVTDAFGRLWEAVNKFLEAFGLTKIDTEALGKSLGNLAIDSLVKVVDGITDIVNKVTEMKEKWDDFKTNSLDPFIEGVKSYLLPVLEDLKEELDDLKGKLGENGIEIDELKIAVGILTGAIILLLVQVGLLIGGFLALLKTINTLIEAHNKLTEFFTVKESDSKFLTWIKDVAAAFSGIVTPVYLVQRAVDKLKDSMEKLKETEAYKILKGTFSYTGKQSGGIVLNSGFHKINEAGQEMAYLPRGTKVLNARRTEEMQGGQTINIVNNMNTELDEQLLVDRLTYQLRLI